MLRVLLHIGVLSLTFLLLSRSVSGVRVRSPHAAVIVAIAFSVFNFFLGFVLTWVLRAFLVVPALFTTGLAFLLVPFLVNAILLWLTDRMLASISISSIRGLLWSATAITLVNGLFSMFCSNSLYMHSHI